jgi:hypothetical protein
VPRMIFQNPQICQGSLCVPLCMILAPPIFH